MAQLNPSLVQLSPGYWPCPHCKWLVGIEYSVYQRCTRAVIAHLDGVMHVVVARFHEDVVIVVS